MKTFEAPVPQHRAWRLTLLALVATAAVLAGCGDKKDKASQTAVKVNKGEITVHQINSVLQQQRNIRPEQVDAASRQILEQLIQQELAIQKAEDDKLDRDPRVVTQIENAKGRRKLVPSGEPDELHECDDVLVAVGQENAFPFIERDIGMEFDEWGMPVVDTVTYADAAPWSPLPDGTGPSLELRGLGFDNTDPAGSLNVSLFDVADLAHPAMLARVPFGGQWSMLPEDQDRIHKAFKIVDDLGAIAVAHPAARARAPAGPFSHWPRPPAARPARPRCRGGGPRA